MIEKIRPLLPYLKNKYVLVLLVAGTWLLFFDRYNLFGQGKVKAKIREYEKECTYYKTECETLRERQIVLNSNPAELEKYAREKYLMKKADEDLFLLKKKNKALPNNK